MRKIIYPPSIEDTVPTALTAQGKGTVQNNPIINTETTDNAIDTNNTTTTTDTDNLDTTNAIAKRGKK